MKIFVTGATGFIGSHFLNHAFAEGHDVVAPRRASALPRIPLSKEPVWLDKQSEDLMATALEGCDVLVHLGAAGVIPGATQWEKCYDYNVTESVKLWKLAEEAGVRDFIICGSCSEYGRNGESLDFIPATAALDPVDAYGGSKAAASISAIAFARERKVRMKILRPFHVYGEGEALSRFWPGLKTAASSGKDYPMTKGEQVRDFISVEDVAARFCDELDFSDLKPAEVMIANIGRGHPVSLLDFAHHWWEKWDAKGRLLPGSLEYRSNEVMRYVPDLTPYRFF